MLSAALAETQEIVQTSGDDSAADLAVLLDRIVLAGAQGLRRRSRLAARQLAGIALR